jgi:hypothetical protein
MIFLTSWSKNRRANPLLSFDKNHYRIGRHIEKSGRNILVTDHTDWSTDETVRASLDRHMVEKAFRQNKDDDRKATSRNGH